MERLEGLERRTRKRIIFIRDATQGDCGYTKARSFDRNTTSTLQA
jgi:hypothetical protein